MLQSNTEVFRFNLAWHQGERKSNHRRPQHTTRVICFSSWILISLISLNFCHTEVRHLFLLSLLCCSVLVERVWHQRLSKTLPWTCLTTRRATTTNLDKTPTVHTAPDRQILENYETMGRKRLKYFMLILTAWLFSDQRKQWQKSSYKQDTSIAVSRFTLHRGVFCYWYEWQIWIWQYL